MKILIVDDKKDVVQGILEGVNWKNIGNLSLFGAYSGAEALAVIEKEGIQLLITDIEMPGLSGLELAAKVREKDENMGIIILTSHDSFRYAQNAIRLRCNDYVLQPVDYSVLENAVIKVINEMFFRQEKNAAGHQEQFEENLKNRREEVWKRLILEDRSLSDERINELLEQADIFLRAESRCTAVLAEPLLLTELLGAGGEYETFDKSYDVLRQMLSESAPPLAELRIRHNLWLFLFKEEDPAPFFRLIPGAPRELNCTMAVYVSDHVQIRELPGAYRALIAKKRDNVAGYEGVFMAGSGESGSERSGLDDSFSVRKWKDYIIEGHEARIREEVETFLKKKRKARELNRGLLVLLVQMITNTFYSLDGSEAERLMSSDQISACYVQSTESPENLLAYLDEVIEGYREKRTAETENNGPVLIRRMKNYIRDNIGKKLDREEVADHFFVSRDYVTHLFNRFENVSFTQYVTGQKLERAKDMIRRSGLPMKAISLNVGFSDYAYFSKVFKEYTGQSPFEYRKQSGGAENDKG